MKRVKIAFWIIVIGFIALVVFQNKFFFMAKQSLAINLWIKKYNTPEIANAIFFLVCFFAGLLAAYFASLSGRFKSKKTIKNLKTSLDSQSEIISELKEEVELLKSDVFGEKVSDNSFDDNEENDEVSGGEEKKESV